MTSSISIIQLKDGDMIDSIPLNSKGHLEVDMSETNPSIGTFDDATTKLKYLICLINKDKPGSWKNNSMGIEKVVKDNTDAKSIIVNNFFDSMWNYVDRGDNKEKLITDDDIKNFIFNPKSLLIIYK